jgi:broad specificity phosphatase PhoE
MNQTTIYLIRHGEVHNPDGIIYGRLPNFGLTEKGRGQLNETAEFLQDKKISVLYASPLDRAKESAEIIKNKLNIPELHISKLLYETQTSYEGRKFYSLDRMQSEVYLKPLNPTDETIEQLAERMKQFIDEMIAKYNGETIAAVGHGDPIMAIKAVIKKRPLDFMSFKTDHYIKHGEVLEIIADGDHRSISEVFKPVINK